MKQLNARANGSTAVVVNDDLTKRSMLAGLLQQEDIHVLTFGNVGEALASLDPGTPPDLIVTDLYMPGIDGLRFCHLLRSPEYTAFNKVPLLVVSATFAGEEALHITAGLGNIAFLASPVDGTAFLDAARALIAGERPPEVPRILIVENSRKSAGLLRKAFTAHGWRADIALTARAGAEAFEKAPYDAAVLDCHLPDGESDALLDAFTSRRPGCVCIMIATDPKPELALDWMKRGAAAYLRKPFDPDHLIELCTRTRRERSLLRVEDMLEKRTHLLRESEARYRAFFEGINDAVFVHELDERGQPGRFLDCNEAACLRLGYTREELLSLTPRDITEPAEYERLAHRRGEFGGRGIILIETIHVARDGRKIPVEGNIRLITYLGRPAALSISRDITVRKRTEQDLLESEAKYRLIFDNVGETIFIAQDGLIKFGNHNTEKLTGYTLPELMSRPFLAFIHPDDRPLVIGRHLARLRGELPEADKYEFRIIHKGGDTRTVQLSTSRMEWEGRPATINFLNDITEQKKVEDALRVSEEWYRAIYDASPLAMVVWDRERRVVDWNRQAEQVFGWTREEILGKDFFEFLLPGSALPAVVGVVDLLLAGRLPSRSINENLTKRGETILCEWNNSIRRDSQGQVTGVISLALDVTERKRAEDAKKLNEERLEALVTLNDMTGADERELTHFAMEAAVRLTGSTIGYVAFMNEDETVLTMHAWSEQAMRECSIADKPIVYPVASTGLWGEAVRRRKAVVTNDYSAPNPWKKGMPNGHVRVARHMNAPTFDGDRIVIVAGVGNKPTGYSDDDVRQLSLLMSGLWTLIRRRRMEDALRQSETKYRSLTERMNDILWTCDLEMNTTYVSPSVERVLGFTVEERIRQRADEQVTPETLRLAAERLEDELRHDGEREPDRQLVLETGYYHKDGTVRCLESALSFIRDGGGRPVGIQGLSRDITGPKAAEAALRQSEERYRTILNEMEEGYQEVDLAGQFTFFNEAFLRLFGYNRDEMMGTNFSRYAAEEAIAKKVYRAYNHMYKTGIPIKSFEWDIIRKDGARRTLEFYASMLKDAEDRPTGFRGIVRDVTDHRRAENQLRESESRLRTILETVQTGIMIVDAQTHIVLDLNGIAAAIIREEKENIIGKICHRHVCPAEQGKCPVTDLGCTVDNSERLLIRADGKSVPIIKTVVPILLEGRPCLLESFSDISGLKQAREALERSEQKYREIFENATEGIFQTTPEGRYLSVNPAFAGMFGYASPEEMMDAVTDIGRQLYVNPKDREEMVGRLREQDRLEGYEVEVFRRDGSRFWISINIHNVRDEQGNLLYLEGTNQDITERKRVEAALRESEERYKNYVEKSFAGVYVVQDGRFVFLNDNAAAFAGYRPDELVGRPSTSIVHPDDLNSTLERSHKMLRGEVVSPHEFRIVKKDGQVRWIMETVTSITYKGRRAILGNSMDITERRQAEKALRESERRLADIIEFLPDATLVIDRDGRVIAWNRAIEELTGIGKQDMLGRGNYEYAVPFYGERRPILIDLALRPDSEKEKKYKAVQRTGDILFGEAHCPNLPPGDTYLSGTASVLRDAGGRIIAAIECIRNSTERKKMEERLGRAEKMEALGLLAGGVAHDLNNVLGVVIGYSELLLSHTDPSGPIRSHVANIVSGGEKAAAIVQDLLTLARRGVPNRKVLNLNKIVSDCRQSPEFANFCSMHASVQVRFELAPDLLNVSGSAVHIGKTLFNLISNAGEAMPNGGLLSIRTANQYLDRPIRGYDEVREGDYVVLSVSDRGEGIHVSDLKRIFEPFYTKKVMGRSGTGLGLAVVWGTVKDHQGYINVESEEGRGSTFTLYFPVTREEVSVDRSTVSASEYGGKGESILIVDDIEGQRELAAAMLQRLNYRTAVVASGEEAVEYLKEHPVDLVVLDMIMEPGMDGLDTYRQVLEIRPGQKAIIVSGFSETQRVSAAQGLGAGAYVKKPYVIEKLGMAVRKELDRVRMNEDGAL
jgi:PAS domain S-box-containing protein